MCSPGSAIWEKKKKKSGEDGTEGYLQLQIEWLKESAGDRSLWAVVGLKGKHRSAPLLFWLLLLWSPLEGIGSPLNRILFPHGCHRAHPPFLQTCLVKPVATCYSFSTEYMYTSVCFAKVKMPSKESVMQETFWMMEQGTAVNYLIQFTRLSGVGGWNLGMWSSPRWWITGVYAKSALLITLPCFLMQDKETKKSLQNYGNTGVFWGRRGMSLIFKVPFRFCKINTFLLGVSYFHIGRAQKLTLCREGSPASLHSFLVALLTIANPQPLFTSRGRSWGFCLWVQPQASSSSFLCLSDPSLVPFPLYDDENWDRLNVTCLQWSQLGTAPWEEPSAIETPRHI